MNLVTSRNESSASRPIACQVLRSPPARRTRRVLPPPLPELLRDFPRAHASGLGGALAYLTGRMPGAPVPHSEIAAKGHAIAEMLFAIESSRALYYRAISEAQVDAPLEAVQRARAAHVTVQRAVVAVTQEAIRVCGGRAFLKRYPLERYARDARAAALMRPWTQELATQQAWEAALGLEGQRGGAAGA